jgi:hypothetical protein
MLKSISGTSLPAKFGRCPRARVIKKFTALLSAVLFFGIFCGLVPAFAQADFGLTASPPSPFAVTPGQPSASTLTLTTLNSASGIDVALSCAVTPVQPAGTPLCTVSPASVTTPASPSLTITTSSATPATLYTITVTGVAAAISVTHTASANLSVLGVTPDYTLTVTTALSPTSVHAGSGATAVVTVTPLDGYSGTVTLSCSAVTPTSTPGPTCSFQPPAVTIVNSGVQTSTLTITTIGPAPATSYPRNIYPGTLDPRIFYALWLPLPGLALLGLRYRSRKLLATIALCVVGGGLLLLPACGSSSSSTTSSGPKTPNNTYTFTLTGADANAVAPSNGTQTVSLTVN